MFYFQAPCVVPHELYTPRLMAGLAFSCLAVFIYFISTIYFDYSKCIQNTSYLRYDVETITAGDYTVQFGISSE
jgi:hypothetical protein